MAIFVIITCFSLLLANPHVKESQSKVIKDGIDIAKDAIISGKAQEKLEQIIKISQQLS